MEFGQAAWFVQQANLYLYQDGGYDKNNIERLIEFEALKEVVNDQTPVAYLDFYHSEIADHLADPYRFLKTERNTINRIISQMPEHEKNDFHRHMEEKCDLERSKDFFEGKQDIDYPKAWKTIRNTFSNNRRELTQAANHVRNKVIDYMVMCLD